MNFQPCSFPHNDFLMLGGEARHSVGNLAGLRRHVADDATIFHNVTGEPTCTVSGVVIRDRKMELGECRPGAGEALKGRYCGIRPVQDGGAGLELVADELGTIPVYFAETAKGPMASNSIRLIALAMQAAGAPVRLSLGSIASTWFTDNFLCLTQISRETYVEQVFLTLLGQRVVFRKGAMFVSAADPEKGEPPKIEEYRYLLDKGVEEIRENVIATINSGFPVVSTLTGGRDSRIVLGALLSTGREKDVQFSTRDVDEDDSMISTGLAAYFGLSYTDSPDHIRRVGQSFEDDLERFTLGHMGAKTRYKRANVHAVSDHVSLRLIGGAGELYRAVFTKGLSKEILASDINLSSVKRWLRSYWMFNKQDDEIAELIAEQFLDAFEHLGARTLGEGIDLHYANFRNRHHLGAPMQYRQDGNTVLFSPAASPTLFRLARRLPRPAIESDRLIHDLTRALNFDLAHLPYDKPLFLRNPAVAQRATRAQNRLVSRFEPDPGKLKASGPCSVEFTGFRETRNFREFCLESIETQMDFLQEHDVAGKVMTRKFRRMVGNRLTVMQPESISNWLGKFHAARVVAEMT